MVPQRIKQRLYGYSRLALLSRGDFTQVGMPLHGLVLLHGPPGVGKTSLARGLANTLAEDFVRAGHSSGLIFAEVDAHAMPSQMLGESQRNVANLLEKSIPELAAKHLPVIVLLDEVTSLAVDRRMAMGGTDPVDVIRATDAALQGLDRLAFDHPNVLLAATSNLAGAIDEAVMSRVDLAVEIPLPDSESRLEILTDSLSELPSVEVVGADLSEVAAALEGVSGRRLRKLVFEALLTLPSPQETMTIDHLRSAVKHFTDRGMME